MLLQGQDEEERELVVEEAMPGNWARETLVVVVKVALTD